jgi:hypothetical protein
MHYTIQRQNESFGPYTIEQIRAYFQQGSLLVTDLAWAQGSQAPVTVATLLQSAQSDSTGGVIPYKNPSALTSYYLGVASLIPCLGLITGIIALVLGIKGLKRAKAEPWVRGKVHAWVGIILGGGMLLANLAGIVMIFMASMRSRP